MLHSCGWLLCSCSRVVLRCAELDCCLLLLRVQGCMILGPQHLLLLQQQQALMAVAEACNISRPASTDCLVAAAARCC